MYREIIMMPLRLKTSAEGRERYPIRVRYPQELRERFDHLEHILVPTSAGAHVQHRPAGNQER